MSCTVFKQTAVLSTHVSILGPLTTHLEHIMMFLCLKMQTKSLPSSSLHMHYARFLQMKLTDMCAIGCSGLTDMCAIAYLGSTEMCAFGCSGLTDWDITSAWSTLGVFIIGAWAGRTNEEGAVVAALVMSGIAGAAVNAASSIMGDFKTAYYTLAHPRALLCTQVSFLSTQTAFLFTQAAFPFTQNALTTQNACVCTQSAFACMQPALTFVQAAFACNSDMSTPLQHLLRRDLGAELCKGNGLDLCNMMSC